MTTNGYDKLWQPMASDGYDNLDIENYFGIERLTGQKAVARLKVCKSTSPQVHKPASPQARKSEGLKDD